MKLAEYVYPDLYKHYPWSPIEKEIEDFVGREIELQDFWNQLSRLAVRGVCPKQNLAYVGQRKLGKTAFLQRCYELAFWEQEEIVPYYFSFQQEQRKVTIEDIAEKVALTMARQAISFATKDPEVQIMKAEEIYNYLRSIDFPKAERIIYNLKLYEQERQRKKGKLKLEAAWDVALFLSRIMGKRTLLIIDEAQEMEISIYEDGEVVQCKGSIADIIQQGGILTIVSGSQVSMLAYKFLDYKYANRLERSDFRPLFEKDAYELVRRLLGNRKHYSGIERDIYRLVGGNPYYIRQLLIDNRKYSLEHGHYKRLTKREELEQIYEFEVTSGEGTIYRFWDTHLAINAEALNNDPEGHKGLTLRLLYKIARLDAEPATEGDSRKEKFFSYDELAAEFGVSEEEIIKKVLQLRDADLIDNPRHLPEVYSINDRVLATVLVRMHYKILLDNPTRERMEEEIDRFKNLDKRVTAVEDGVKETQKKAEETQRQVEQIQLQIVSLKNGIPAAKGKLNLRKGIRAEHKLHQKVSTVINKQQGVFNGYQLHGDLHNINITTSRGTGCQIDLYARLTRENGTSSKPLALLAEVKDKKSKVSKDDARKFIATIILAQRHYKLKDTIAFYICTGGFSKPALEMLEENGVKCGTSEKILYQGA